MTPELKYLAMISNFTAVMSIPHILNELAKNRGSASVGYPDSPLVLLLWAECLKKAHYNAIVNLACFVMGWGGFICIALQVLQ